MLKRLLPALFAIPLFLGGADAQSGKVAMLLPGSINDQSWNAAGYAGLVKLKEQGMDIAYSEKRPGRRPYRGDEGLCAQGL
jgi:basic membrane lipoprotein Med (substrate-binding protein (PBP1-ABC) superfamily)